MSLSVNDAFVPLDSFSVGGFVLFIFIFWSLSFVLHICGYFFFFASEMCFETDITTKHWNEVIFRGRRRASSLPQTCQDQFHG